MVDTVVAENVRKTFRSGWRGQKRKEALKGVDLKINEGEIFGILGPNGAGKTTLLSILSTLLLPDRGRIEILGIDALRHGHRIREKVNISSGNANFLYSLTVKENLHFYGMLYGHVGSGREKKVKEVIDLLDLKDHQDVLFDRISTGTKQRVSLAKCLLNDPEVLFLDEPTVGLDPSGAARIRKEIRSIQKERKMTVLLTTHNMIEAENLCGRIAFLKDGKILTTGTPRDLKRMVRIGDIVRMEVEGPILEEALRSAEGVITYTISDSVCEILVDEGEVRLGQLAALLSQGGARVKRVTVRQTDLEDVFLELAKSRNGMESSPEWDGQ
jgi:ABC-2 type transport system ATP-binding protein